MSEVNEGVNRFSVGVETVENRKLQKYLQCLSVQEELVWFKHGLWCLAGKE